MRNVWMKKAVKLLVVAGLVISSVVPFRDVKLTTQATSSSSTDIQSQIDDTRNQISDIQSKINDEQNNLTDINNRIDGLTDEQDLIEEKIADIQAEIQNTMTSIGMLEDEIAEKKQAIADKKAEIDVTEAAYEEAKATAEKQYDDMIQHIRITYENGSTSYLDLLLSGNGFGDLLNRMDFIEQVYAYDQHMLDNYIAAQNQVQALWDQLELEKSQLEDDKDQLESDKANLDAQRSNLDAMLAQRRRESANFEAEIARARQEAAVAQAQLKQEQQELRQLQNQLAAQQQQAANANNSGGNNGNSGNSGNTSSEGNSSGGGGNASSYGGSSGSSLGQQIADYACQFVGNPYKSGGTSLTNGADCSGFTYRVYMDFNYSLPRTSYAQRSAGVGVSYSEAQPGDLICYDGHVAIYIGNGKIVHASTERTGIKISNANYREILAVRRII